MKKILYLLTALACFLLTNIPTLHAQEEEESFRLMVFGDSLSAGYRLQPQEAFYSRLEDALNAKGYDNVKVINASISGNTTAQGLARVEKRSNKSPTPSCWNSASMMFCKDLAFKKRKKT